MQRTSLIPLRPALEHSKILPVKEAESDVTILRAAIVGQTMARPQLTLGSTCSCAGRYLAETRALSASSYPPSTTALYGMRKKPRPLLKRCWYRQRSSQPRSLLQRCRFRLHCQQPHRSSSSRRGSLPHQFRRTIEKLLYPMEAKLQRQY